MRLSTAHLSFRRLHDSAVAWSISFNFLRLASGLLLLPLLLRLLTKADLGIYYVFLSLNAVVVVLDVGFSPTIGRFVTYAMGGAKKLSALGLEDEHARGTPNYTLLWELLISGRVFYRIVASSAVLILGSLGSLMIWMKVMETSSPQLTWIAWGISVLAVAAETYFGYWNVFLRNMNQVLAATRIAVLVYAMRLVFACGLLLCGGGLLSLPIASLTTTVLLSSLSRRRVLHALSHSPAPSSVNWKEYLKTIWPNSWRLGLHLGGAYMGTNVNVLLCSTYFGLEANATYAFSLQVMNIAAGMAAVWTAVKWPVLGQLVAQRNLSGVRKTLRPRLWLHLASFMAIATAAIILGPTLIRLIGSDKEMLPIAWMVLMAANTLLDSHCTVWNTLISYWNHLPMLWASLFTSISALGLNLLFLRLPDANPGYLILGPILAGIAFNYWYWPGYGARALESSWAKFAFASERGG